MSSIRESITNAVSAATAAVGRASIPTGPITDVQGENPNEGGRANYGVVYAGPKKVEVKNMGYPTMKNPEGETMLHAVILKVICSGICGSDLHMFRGRTSVNAADQLILGHEITGEIVEMGADVTQFHVGDYVSVPFNIGCGRCINCKERKTSICLNGNHLQPSAIYGYAMMGKWRGGQAQYVAVPFADFNLLQLYSSCQPDPDHCQKKHYQFNATKEQILAHLVEIATLSDILPTAMNGAVQARVGLGSTVYVAGAGPVGLCCAVSCFLLGASKVIIADSKPDRLELAKKIAPAMQLYTINLNEIEGGSTDQEHIASKIKELIGSDTVDCSVDCVGYESCGCGREVEKNVSEQVLNTCGRVTKAGGGIGVPGLYLPMDPKGSNSMYQQGILPIRYGDIWNKAISIECGQAPVMKYNHDLLKLILADRIHLSPILNAQFISLDEAQDAYSAFDKGVAKKFFFDPNGMVAKNAAFCVGGGATLSGKTAVDAGTKSTGRTV